MYLLTATKTPSQAVEEALQQSAAGGFVTHGRAQELIRNHSENCGDQSAVGDLGTDAVIDDELADTEGDAEGENAAIAEMAPQLDKPEQERLSTRNTAASAALLEALPVADPELAICVTRDWEMNPDDTGADGR